MPKLLKTILLNYINIALIQINYLKTLTLILKVSLKLKY